MTQETTRPTSTGTARKFYRLIFENLKKIKVAQAIILISDPRDTTHSVTMSSEEGSVHAAEEPALHEGEWLCRG